MNDLRSPLEDRPFRANTSRSDERVIATSEYYRTKFGALRQSRWFPLASVLTAVIVFSGVVSYAYKQGSQSGENATTPIITASADTIKEKPENPGGMEVPFQDAVVFDQLQKNTESKEMVENLLAAPEQPATTTTANTATTPAAVATGATTTEVAAPAASEAVPTPAATETPAATTEATTAATTASVAAPKSEEMNKMNEVAPASAPATTKITGGNYRIQMGAFRDEATARAAWGKFQKEFSSQLSSVTPSFPRADLGAKGTFYRVQGVNLSKASADELCRSLNAARAGSCMVVR